VARNDPIIRIVTVAGHTFDFAEGETIHTESSYKYDVEEFLSLATQAGYALVS